MLTPSSKTLEKENHSDGDVRQKVSPTAVARRLVFLTVPEVAPRSP